VANRTDFTNRAAADAAKYPTKVCCVPVTMPTPLAATLTQAAKKSASPDHCYRETVSGVSVTNCDELSVVLKQPMVEITSSDPVYNNNCGTAKPLACKQISNLCYANTFFRGATNRKTYVVTGTYPNTFRMFNGGLECKIAEVDPALVPAKANTYDKNICSKFVNSGAFVYTTGAASWPITGSDTDGACLFSL
jgi:hypothetical protein